MKIAENISVMFRELPFLQRFSEAKRAGFHGIDLQFPYDESADALHRAEAEAGLPVVLMNSPIIPKRYPSPDMTACSAQSITRRGARKRDWVGWINVASKLQNDGLVAA